MIEKVEKVIKDGPGIKKTSMVEDDMDAHI